MRVRKVRIGLSVSDRIIVFYAAQFLPCIDHIISYNLKIFYKLMFDFVASRHIDCHWLNPLFIKRSISIAVHDRMVHISMHVYGARSKSECIWIKKNLMVICIPNVTWRWHVTYYICRHAKPAHTYIDSDTGSDTHLTVKAKNLLLKLNFSNAPFKVFIDEERRGSGGIAENLPNDEWIRNIHTITTWHNPFNCVHFLNEQTNRFR